MASLRLRPKTGKTRVHHVTPKKAGWEYVGFDLHRLAPGERIKGGGDDREVCRGFGAKPHLHKRGRPNGSGLGRRRWPIERSHAWVLENKRLAPRYDRLGVIVQSLLQAACLFLVAGRLVE